jgi:hypothetical protein
VSKSPKLAALYGIKPETKTVTIRFTAEDGRPFDLVVPRGIIPALTLSLIGLGDKIGPTPTSGGIDAQFITVTGAKHGLGPNREPMLTLTIEGTTPVPLMFPREALEPLRTALAELLELSKPASKGH